MTEDNQHRPIHSCMETVTITREQLDAMCAQHEAERAPIIAAGIEALRRLVAVAQRDSGQSKKCGRFLLSCYNGQAWPFDLTDLRGLDRALFEDCMTVLRMDRQPEVEIHQRIEGGDAIWSRFKMDWTTREEAERFGPEFFADWLKLYGRDLA